MKIIDSFMYLDEDMLLDVRLNVLNKHVSKFIICESTYNHKGVKKDLNFDIKKFSNFQDKIIYVPMDQQPSNIKEIKDDDSNELKESKILDNALCRDNFQRNYVKKKFEEFSENDLILINDLDEIPNLENFKYKNKINIFKQKMIYYKFNLLYPDFVWFGSKICKKKHLKSPQWIRNIKSKKYPFWRIDTFFSKKKYQDINFIQNGGWHFTNIKKAEDIDKKMRNFAHHHEYEKSGLNVNSIKKNISERKVFYDHFSDKKGEKFNFQQPLKKIGYNELPSYISKNYDVFKEWID